VTPFSSTLTVIIPVRNDADRLHACLESVSQACTNAGASPQIMVADNGSTDDSPAVARHAGALVLDLPGLRVSAMRNRAAAAARADLLAFIDADHVIDGGWVRAVLEVFDRDDIVAAGAPYVPPDPATWVQRLYDAFRDHRPGLHDVEWLGSGNLVVRRISFEQAGGFDVTLEACEDVDLCRKLRAMGGRLVADSRLRSVHHGDPATLRALFLSELWRGRDNLRVSFRPPVSLGSMSSITIPVVNLICLTLAPTALLAAGRIGAAAAALSVFFCFAGLRAARILMRTTVTDALDPARALIVAAVYDAARALALTLRVPHRRARTGVPRVASPRP
jgi:GT2 family glycosyltransferase